MASNARAVAQRNFYLLGIIPNPHNFAIDREIFKPLRVCYGHAATALFPRKNVTLARKKAVKKYPKNHIRFKEKSDIKSKDIFFEIIYSAKWTLSHKFNKVIVAE